MKSKQYTYGIHAVTALLKQHNTKVEHLYVQHNRNDGKIATIVKLAEKFHIPISEMNRSDMENKIGGGIHQGIIAQCDATNLWGEHDLLALLDHLNRDPLLLILDGVQDPHNLGACLRTANAAQVDAVIIPQDRAASLTPIVRKVACGAAELTPVVQVTNLARIMRTLKERGIWCYGLDGMAPLSLYETTLKGPLAIVMGSEGQGMRRLTKDQCDQLLAIPLQGNVTSLNVSVATGIALFECQRQKIQEH